MSCFKQTILSFGKRVPRYTSYPTAPHFKPIEDTRLYTDALEAQVATEPVSLYLHVPFCSQLCWYCGCHTKITQRYAPVEDYAYLMMREIEMLADYLGERQQVGNIHFGGGSPGMLRACDFEKIMQRLHNNFTITDDAKIAIEIDPRGVTPGRVSAYADYGVNRVSLGVQDFDEKVLKAVNREQPYELSEKAVELFRSNGIDHINVDLMYGLPHQTVDSLIPTLDKLMNLSPDRIAYFGYAHVPWMKKHMRLIKENDLPAQDLRLELFDAAQDYLTDYGYVALGIDHFVKPDDSFLVAYDQGKLHRNFQGYTDDQNTAMFGIGVSSIGKTVDAYFQNSPDMPIYKEEILANRLPAGKYCPVSSDDKIRADVIEQLMCYMRVDLEQMMKRHNVNSTYFETEIVAMDLYKTMGFITLENDSVITILPHAKPMVRIICSEFDSYIDRSSFNTDDINPKHAQAF